MDEESIMSQTQLLVAAATAFVAALGAAWLMRSSSQTNPIVAGGTGTTKSSASASAKSSKGGRTADQEKGDDGLKDKKEKEVKSSIRQNQSQSESYGKGKSPLNKAHQSASPASLASLTLNAQQRQKNSNEVPAEKADGGSALVSKDTSTVVKSTIADDRQQKNVVASEIDSSADLVSSSAADTHQLQHEQPLQKQVEEDEEQKRDEQHSSIVRSSSPSPTRAVCAEVAPTSPWKDAPRSPARSRSRSPEKQPERQELSPSLSPPQQQSRSRSRSRSPSLEPSSTLQAPRQSPAPSLEDSPVHTPLSIDEQFDDLSSETEIGNKNVPFTEVATPKTPSLPATPPASPLDILTPVAATPDVVDVDIERIDLVDNVTTESTKGAQPRTKHTTSTDSLVDLGIDAMPDTVVQAELSVELQEDALTAESVVQAGGHADAFESRSDGTIVKKCNSGEWRFYQNLSKHDDLARFVPRLYEVLGSATNSPRVVMENLLHGYSLPCILDIKMGTTSAAPDASVEKRESMLAKDMRSTTASLGFRVTGFKTWDNVEGCWVQRSKEWSKLLTEENVGGAIRDFMELPHVGAVDRDWKQDVVVPFVKAIEAVEHYLCLESKFKFISSSLFFVQDASPEPKCTLKMIDFAHVFPLADGEKDEGFLLGLKNLLIVLRKFLDDDSPANVEPPAADTPLAFTEADAVDPEADTANAEAVAAKVGAESTIDPGVAVDVDAVVSVTPPSSDAEKEDIVKERCSILVAEYSFAARSEREVDIVEGDRIAVAETDESGWWRGKNMRTGRTGWFPQNYCKATNEFEMVAIEPEDPDSDSSSDGENSIFHVPDLNKVPVKSCLKDRSTTAEMGGPRELRSVIFDEEVEVLEMSDDDQWSSSSGDDRDYDFAAWDPDDDDDDDWDYEQYLRGIGNAPADMDSDESGTSDGEGSDGQDESDSGDADGIIPPNDEEDFT